MKRALLIVLGGLLMAQTPAPPQTKRPPATRPGTAPKKSIPLVGIPPPVIQEEELSPGEVSCGRSRQRGGRISHTCQCLKHRMEAMEKMVDACIRQYSGDKAAYNKCVV